MFLAAQLATLVLGAASCPSNLANELGVPPPTSSQQLITIEAATARTTYATARTWIRADGCWTPAGGPYTARVGRNGVRRNKREGDGSTPAGTFPIGGRMYGNSPSPGVAYPYVRLRCDDWWVEDSRSSPDLSTSPRAYAHLAVVEYNMHPVVRGRGSGIFLHVQIGKATSGCISLRRPALIHVLRWLRPEALPQLAIGAKGSLRQSRGG
jgi:L,D-peptidoglycan transpeptidase YkuD (ErfK/YbiS/YcfS/YnhG family)